MLQPICLDSLAGNARILGVSFMVIKKKEKIIELVYIICIISLM